MYLWGMFSIFSDEYFMQQALREALQAFEEGEVPVGAIVTCQKQIIARAHNQTERLFDVTAHAEMLAITAAANHLGAKYLNQCCLYVTLEPCLMCAGALAWSQLGELVIGAPDERRGFLRYGEDVLHPNTVVRTEILAEESRELLQRFFRERRANNS